MDFAGQRIGPYTIERLIGQGGMGSVYLAAGPDGSRVALKLLHMHLTAIDEYVRRFRHEANLATKLAHPNVVRILEYGEANGQHYIAMEYVEGETLTQRLERFGIHAPGLKATTRRQRGGSAPTPPPGRPTDSPDPSLDGGTHAVRTAAAEPTSPCEPPAPTAGVGQVADSRHDRRESEARGDCLAVAESAGAQAPAESATGASKGIGPERVGDPVRRGSGQSPDTPPVRNLPLPEVLRILRQVAGVLQAAADIGLLHRDLKPQNILLDKAGNAKVLDFGLAKDTGALSSIISMTGQSIGTPPYMSPQQCEGCEEVDVRGDLYSLGATAYQMLTGRPPFPGPTHSAYIKQHCEEIPTPVCKVNPAVPKNLSQVIDRMLAKNPADRHQTPAELIEDLNRVERGEVPLRLHKPKKARQHNPLLLWGAVAAAVLVTLVAVGGWLWCRRQHAGAAIAEQAAIAKDLAARGDLNAALRALDAVIAVHLSDGSDPSDKSDPLNQAKALRGELREKRLQRHTTLLAAADGAAAVGNHALAVSRYEEALTLGATTALQQKLASAKSAQLAAEQQAAQERQAMVAKADAERRARELEAARQRTAEETERQRETDLRKALVATENALGSEDRFEAALTAADTALDLARSDDERAKAQAAYDKARIALRNRREWAAVVEFTVDPSVHDRTITGTAVAAKFEQRLGDRYRLVTRAQIGRALQELNFSIVDLTDPEKAQRFGKLVSARQIVTGSVVQLGETLTVAAQIFTVETGAIRQTAEVEARSAGEFNAQFAELARILPMTNEEKKKYLDEQRNYPRLLAQGLDFFDRERYAEAIKAFEQAHAAKATVEVETLLGQAREKAEEQRTATLRAVQFQATLTEGERLLAAGDWAGAEAAFRKGLAVPGHAGDRRALDGMSVAQRGAAMAEKKRVYDAAVAAAMAALAKDDLENAGREVQKALAADPDGAEAKKVADKLTPGCRYDAAVAAATAALARDDFEHANREVRKALKLNPDGVEAKALAGKLIPTLTVRVELDGKPVSGTKITLTPAPVAGLGSSASQVGQSGPTYALVPGTAYALTASMPSADGKAYTTAKTTLTADWHGPKLWIAAIALVAGPVEGQSWTVPDLGMPLVYIRPGSFQMGANGAGDDEKPVHSVRISRGFWMGKYEVTQAEYEGTMGRNPSRFHGARYPVEKVSWTETAEFCRKLTEHERVAGRVLAGYEYRLPTEAEWEYACRAGTTGDYAGDVEEMAWYDKNSGNETHEVGTKKANAWGLHDMHGSVWEWCYDWYDTEYYERSPAADPVNMHSTLARAVRGGSWFAPCRDVRSARRFRIRPALTDAFLGFRACLAPQCEGRQ